MTIEITNSDFFFDSANFVYEDILFGTGNYFYSMGKTYDIPSLSTHRVDDVYLSEEELSRVRNDIVILKRIFANDVSLVIRRIDWSSGKVFDQWSHLDTMEEKDFYCVTSENKVYKCLDNAQDSPSVEEPSVVSIEPIRTADGYLWKYMYTISETKDNKFSSDFFIPVQKAITDTFYSRGAIEEMKVVNGGSGYPVGNATVIVVDDTGHTTGSGATADIDTIDLMTGGVSSIVVTDGGSDYTLGAKARIISSTGHGAILSPVIDPSTNEITSISILDPGFGYDAASDTIEISVGEAVLIPVVSKTTNEIIDVIVDDPGCGYVTPPDLSLYTSRTDATGKYGTNTSAVLKAIIDEGEVVRAVIEDPGQNYAESTEVSILVFGDGEGASFEPIIDSRTGTILSAKPIDKGFGYTFANISVSSAYGGGALLVPKIKQSDFGSDQYIIEQTAVDGAIHAIRVDDQGDNFIGSVDVILSGDGTGAAAEAIVDGRKIERIVVTNPGSGYTYCNVSVANEYGSGFVGHCLLSPISGGHGKNAPKELFAKTICIFSILMNTESLENLTNNPFFQFGVIKNPITLNTNARVESGDENGVQCVLSFVPSDPAFIPISANMILVETDTNVRYRVLSIDRPKGKIHLQQLSSILKIPNKQFYERSNPSDIIEMTGIDQLPLIDKHSGNLLFLMNKDGITINEEQFVSFNTYISFNRQTVCSDDE